LIRYDPHVPRVGFGFAAVVMSAVTFGLMVVLPSVVEQDGFALALRIDAHHTTADMQPSKVRDIRCTVPAAVNAPLFAAVRITEPDAPCKQPS
jgi:hypothetical protein